MNFNDLSLKAKLKNIKTLVFDVDGVFTDCSLSVGDADTIRTYNVRDGYAINIALKAGFKLAIISGGKQESIRKRLGGLGITDIFLSVDTDQKPLVFEKYVLDHNLNKEEVLYMGDDIPDLLLMKDPHLFKACPADAVAEVKEIADYISPINGGRGTVREVIELVMKAQGKWLTVF